MKKTTVAISILAALLLGATAQAEMITLDGDQTAGNGALTINQDITFKITADFSGGLFFVFDEIVTSDGGSSVIDFSGLEFSFDEGPRFSILQWVDNAAETASNYDDITSNDGLIVGNHLVELFTGDFLTLHAGTGYMTHADPNFNPWASGDYNVFLAGTDDGQRISENGVVPEPATASMMALVGALGFFIRRHFIS